MPIKKIADVTVPEICLDPDHNAPSMIVLPPGVYEHVCPGCGRKQVFRVSPRPTL